MTRCALPLVLLTVLAVHMATRAPSEPFYNGDETRHVMTGIFMADAFAEAGYLSPKQYAEQYYAQYPVLGLIVWPPGFYAVEGVAMLAFGRTYVTARAVTLGYLLLACTFLFRLAKLTHGVPTAIVTTLVFAFSREVFYHSRNVMLEVPALAFVLMAMLHLEKYLKESRRRDLCWLALACILAGLHRYDAVLLLPLMIARLAFARQWRVLLRRDVIYAAFAVILALAPVYGLAAWEIGELQSAAAARGTDPTVIQSNRIEQFAFLFTTLWAQLGHAACAMGAIGLLLSFRKSDREKSAPYWSLALATYLLFAPMAEQETRHAIFWIPAWSVWAAVAALELQTRFQRTGLTLFLAAVLIASTLNWTLQRDPPWVHGYSDATREARTLMPDEDGAILFDGLMSGTMAYELRMLDPQRKHWLFRGDKFFSANRSDPHHGYIEWVADEPEILKLLDDLAPDAIVVEQPHGKFQTPMSRKLREVLKSHPEKFRPVIEIPVQKCSFDWLDGVGLMIYKPTRPRPAGPRKLIIPMLWQNRSIEAVIPSK